MKNITTQELTNNNTFVSTNNIVPTTKQIVFIDSQIEDYPTLAVGVLPNIKVVVLDSHKNGIKQITTVLNQHSQIATVHIVSHGSPGCLYLGNTQLSLDTLNEYGEDLKTWFDKGRITIPTPYSLLLYGCNLAAGDAGEEFITKLHHITGANIHASTTKVGHAAQGGNWELDFVTNDIKVDLAFDRQAQNIYSHTLVAPEIDLNGSDGTGKNYSTTFTGIEAINFNNSETIPERSDRTIEVVVNDGDANSNTAISTIQWDNDGDTVADVDDIDDDNDGIVDLFEADIYGSASWSNFNTTAGTLNGNIGGAIASAEPISSLGSSLTISSPTDHSDFSITSATALTLAEAIANNEYVEMTFTPSDFGGNGLFANTISEFKIGAGTDDFNYALYFSEDGFTTEIATGSVPANSANQKIEINHPTLGSSTFVQIDFDAGDESSSTDLLPKDIAFLSGVPASSLNLTDDFIL